MKMPNKLRRIAALVPAASLLQSVGQAQVQGPSTLQTPYLLPAVPGVITKSIASNGDGSSLAPDETHPRLGGGVYRLVGIPDGLGAYDNGDNTFTLLVNHELGTTNGLVRSHGTTGAFVSKWNIDKSSLAVNHASDLIASVAPVAGGAAPFGRFCSADLAGAGAFYNPATGLGTQNRLFLNGEETGTEGRAFATVVDGPNAGTAHYLPALGRFSWENAVASPHAQNKTIVVGTDDSSPGQVYVYVGNKTTAGTEIDRAGLNNGRLYGVTVSGAATESRATGLGAASATFALTDLSGFASGTGAALQTASAASGVTEFLRPEDGAWDPRPGKQNDFYFVTTDRFDQPGQQGRSRLWRMRFNDIANPESGGVLTMLLDGTEGQQMFDNLCIDAHGRILIQEDPGGQSYLAKVWLYDIDSGGLATVAQFDPARFSGASSPFNIDEESSGIIDAGTILGDGWFLLDVQAHYTMGGPNGSELVQGGQLLAMYVDPSVVPEPAGLMLLALTAIPLLRRRAGAGIGHR
ncbi:alkaline phosphatase PhoX [Fontivita pretiosa]|uniref:alkaline phosphatase PhoX n=1 Tax=Fontivita pretiosa TaxID=2989684 RepID=UPI003D170F9F